MTIKEIDRKAVKKFVDINFRLNEKEWEIIYKWIDDFTGKEKYNGASLIGDVSFVTKIDKDMMHKGLIYERMEANRVLNPEIYKEKNKQPYEMTSKEFKEYEKKIDIQKKEKRYNEQKITIKKFNEYGWTEKNAKYIGYEVATGNDYFEFEKITKRKYRVTDSYMPAHGLYTPQKSYDSKNIDDVIDWANNRLKEHNNVGGFVIMHPVYGWDSNHKDFVEYAIYQGKTIPEKVLNEYPELIK